MNRRIVGNDRERFFSYVHPEPNTGCWLWAGSTTRSGYGNMLFRGRHGRAHRVAWTLLLGEIPEGACVLHRCDVPSCVNPTHLFLGDQGTNMRDMASKGRQVFQKNPARVARGERSARAKLSAASVVEIVRLVRSGIQQRSVAAKFSVSFTTVNAIMQGRNWGHLTGIKACAEAIGVPSAFATPEPGQ